MTKRRQYVLRIHAILARQPDIVLADIRVPVLSGLDLLKRLAAIAPRFSGMPFFLTAYSDRPNELEARRLAAAGQLIEL